MFPRLPLPTTMIKLLLTTSITIVILQKQTQSKIIIPTRTLTPNKILPSQRQKHPIHKTTTTTTTTTHLHRILTIPRSGGNSDDETDTYIINGNDIIEINPNYSMKRNTTATTTTKTKRKRKKSKTSSSSSSSTITRPLLSLIYTNSNATMVVVKNITTWIERNRNVLLLGTILLFLFRFFIQHSNTISTPSMASHLIQNMIELSPSQFLKIMLFLDVMRKVVLHTRFSSGRDSVFLPQTYQTLSFERLHLRQSKNIVAYERALDLSFPPKKTSFLLQSVPKSFQPMDVFLFVRSHIQNYTSHFFSNKDATSPNTSRENNNTILVLEFRDVPSSTNTLINQIAHLQQSIDLLLQLPYNTSTTDCRPQVIIQLTSQGGPVSEYGLASYYISTLRKANYNVTVFIDTVAASGGYMMACQANTIYATPSSIVGSIGVLSQSINFHPLLNKLGIYNQVFRSSNAKAPITPLGSIPDNGEEIMQRMIARVHDFFINVVQEQRGSLQKETVFNGDVFLGREALRYNLIDGIMSSEEYITSKIQEGYNVLKIVKVDGSNTFLLPWNRFGDRSMRFAWKNMVSFMGRSVSSFMMTYFDY